MSLFRGSTDNLTDPAIKPGGAVDLDLSVLTGSVFTHNLTKTYVNTPTTNSVPPKLYFQFWRDGSWSTSVDSNQAGIVDGFNVFTETWGNWIEPNNYTYGPQHWIRYHINSIVGNGTNSLGGAAGATGAWVNGASNPQCWIQLNDINVGATYVVEWFVEMSNSSSGSPVIDSATFQLQVGNNIKTYTVEYLIVAGGGGARHTGGAGSSSAGGAGGVVLGSCKSDVLFPLAVSNPYGIYANFFTCGIGRGSRYPLTAPSTDNPLTIYYTTSGAAQGGNTAYGSASSIGSIVAFGGAGGTPTGENPGLRGGSGAGTNNVTRGIGGSSSQISYPAFGGVGYGNKGGDQLIFASNGTGGGGAGGAGASPAAGAGATAAGGSGLVSSITGTAVEYARGGSWLGGLNAVLNMTYGGGGGAKGLSGNPATAMFAQRGNDGIIILAYPSEAGLLNVGGGLIYTLDTTTRPGYNVYSFTDGGSDVVVFPLP